MSSCAGLTRASIILCKILLKKMDCRVKPVASLAMTEQSGDRRHFSDILCDEILAAQEKTSTAA
jgi:hypothetical protein